MGQDYSYSQPSSSSAEFDVTSHLEAEAQTYADEAQSTYTGPVPVHYPPQSECDEGIPRICYCGGEPLVATAYTSKDPGRRYFTCANVDDGECHIWKWFDVAVLEEMRDVNSQVRQLKDEGNASAQKLLVVEKTLHELAKKEAVINKILVCLLVIIGLMFFVLLGIGSKGSSRSVLLPHQWI